MSGVVIMGMVIGIGIVTAVVCVEGHKVNEQKQLCESLESVRFTTSDGDAYCIHASVLTHEFDN